MDPTGDARPGANQIPGLPRGGTFRASVCLPTGYHAADPVIDRYHELVADRTDLSPMGWTLAEHLGKCYPQSVMDDSWDKVLAVADELQWGGRDDNGKLTEEAATLLDRAWGVYCQFLRFPRVLADQEPGSRTKPARVLTGTKWENGAGRIDGHTGMPYAGGDYYGVWDVDDYLDGIKRDGAFDCEASLYKAFWLDVDGKVHPVKRHDALTRNPDTSPWPNPDERGWIRVRIVSRDAVEHGEPMTPLTNPMLDLQFTQKPSTEQQEAIRHLMKELDTDVSQASFVGKSEGFDDWLRDSDSHARSATSHAAFPHLGAQQQPAGAASRSGPVRRRLQAVASRLRKRRT